MLLLLRFPAEVTVSRLTVPSPQKSVIEPVELTLGQVENEFKKGEITEMLASLLKISEGYKIYSILSKLINREVILASCEFSTLF